MFYTALLSTALFPQQLLSVITRAPGPHGYARGDQRASTATKQLSEN